MRNYISRTNKDHIFAFEEWIKNKTYFERGLDMVTSGTL